MVSLEKTVKMYLRFKRYDDGIWHTKAFRGKKTDADIARILTEAFKMDIPLGSPMTLEQRNWAGTYETVILVDYQPFRTIWINRDHIHKP